MLNICIHLSLGGSVCKKETTTDPHTARERLLYLFFSLSLSLSVFFFFSSVSCSLLFPAYSIRHQKPAIIYIARQPASHRSSFPFPSLSPSSWLADCKLFHQHGSTNVRTGRRSKPRWGGFCFCFCFWLMLFGFCLFFWGGGVLFFFFVFCFFNVCLLVWLMVGWDG